MLDKLLFGRYIQGDSYVHKMDPRAKLIGAFYFIIVIVPLIISAFLLEVMVYGISVASLNNNIIEGNATEVLCLI